MDGNTKKYSVLSYVIGDYEIMHEIPQECMNDEIEYIFVTDNHSFTSSTWTVVYADDLTGSTFNKCYEIRFNPFKYCHTDIVMRIDGSMAINKDLMPLFMAFESTDADCMMMVHPTRNTMWSEYEAWCKTRNYPIAQADKILNFMANNGYDVKNYKGLFQYNFCIQRNNEIINRLNKETYDLLVTLAPEGEDIERVDQTVGSFVINTHYPNLKVFPTGQFICFGHYFNWCSHGTDIPMVYNSAFDIEPFIGNRSVTVFYV